MLYNIYADISLISEIYSSELIILCFSDFLHKKINWQSQPKILHHKKLLPHPQNLTYKSTFYFIGRPRYARKYDLDKN